MISDYPTLQINYSATQPDINGKYVYEFIRFNNTVHIISNHPFSRGDTVKIEDIDYASGTIYVEPVEYKGDSSTLPVLLILAQTVPTSIENHIALVPSNRYQLVYSVSNEYIDNKFYLGVVLVNKLPTRVQATITKPDSEDTVTLEWSIFIN